jgi:hypothetical protein
MWKCWQGPNETLELGVHQLCVDVFGTKCVGRNEGQVDFCLGY